MDAERPLRHFNPRSPHGERLVQHRRDFCLADISTHAPRTGSDTISLLFCACATISTHAPRTGSDAYHRLTDGREADFNPRSPHGERHPDYFDLGCFDKFQPTLPARGATKKEKPEAIQHPISTHAPRTGSDVAALPDSIFGLKISTHAPRTGSDGNTAGRGPEKEDFNPRSPHGERQYQRPSSLRTSGYFNPRSPHGERPVTRCFRPTISAFQPTLPARGATGG